MKILVLGAGLVGGPMALDLAKESNFDVTIADISTEKIEHYKNFNIKIIKGDFSDVSLLRTTIQNYDLIVDALPGHYGFQTFKCAIEEGKNIVDIAFFPEDPLPLDATAKAKGVIAIMDCGVAPGMSNILTGYGEYLLDEMETAITYVGGLPKIRKWPYEYKAVFSPIDVIEEYTRPARYIENGQLVIRPALSDPELLNFEGIGTLEAFNSDGIRSLAYTIKAKNIKEKTLRYPGHIEKMAVLRETGFFDKEPIEINGQLIRPLDFTAKLLFPKWKLEEGESDLTVMKVIAEGTKGGKRLRYTWDLYDEYCPETRVHSMARTTGYTATVAVRMIAKGLYRETGVTVPEYIGRKPECVEFLLKGLAERNVIYKEKIETL